MLTSQLMNLDEALKTPIPALGHSTYGISPPIRVALGKSFRPPSTSIRGCCRQTVASSHTCRKRRAFRKCTFQSFPNGEQRVQVSSQGGTEPRWREDGEELFFLRADRMMMAVAVSLRPTVEGRRAHAAFPDAGADPGQPLSLELRRLGRRRARSRQYRARDPRRVGLAGPPHSSRELSTGLIARPVLESTASWSPGTKSSRACGPTSTCRRKC